MAYNTGCIPTPDVTRSLRWSDDRQLPLRQTKHARRRMAQRGQTLDAVVLAFLYGTIYKVGNRTVYFLRRKDVDTPEVDAQMRQLAGLTLVTTPAGDEIITVYQSHAKLNRFKHKWGRSFPSRKPR